MKKQQYKLLHQKYTVGIITLQHEENDIQYGVLELCECIKKRIGWKAQRFSDLFEALAAYSYVIDHEGDDSDSPTMRDAISRLEDGEVGHYLQPQNWFVFSENGKWHGIELLCYRNNSQLIWEWRSCTDYPFNNDDSLFTFDQNSLGCRLELTIDGKHTIGGSAPHTGVCPKGTDVPLHHFFSLDLKDLHSPYLYNPKAIRYLPLYYPLAYGMGGAEVQYEVLSDGEIKIHYMSDSTPDGDGAYVEVAFLPKTQANIVPLSYEEVRMKALEEHPSNIDFDAEDQKRWETIGGNDAICFDKQNTIPLTCHNPNCESHNVNVEFEKITEIAPIEINGKTDFWYEFEGAFITFCFALCPDCRTIFAFNRCD